MARFEEEGNIDCMAKEEGEISGLWLGKRVRFEAWRSRSAA